MESVWPFQVGDFLFWLVIFFGLVKWHNYCNKLQMIEALKLVSSDFEVPHSLSNTSSCSATSRPSKVTTCSLDWYVSLIACNLECFIWLIPCKEAFIKEGFRQRRLLHPHIAFWSLRIAFLCSWA